MKSFFIQLTFIFLIYSVGFSQPDSTYWMPREPCEFRAANFLMDGEEITPVWRHLCIDSTIIGHTYDSTEIGRHKSSYIDGMDHLSFDNGSFISDGYLYSITDSDYLGDVSGVLIEKVDLNTGLTKWKVPTDLRNSPYKEKVLGSYIEGNQLVLYGVRSTVDIYRDFYLAFGNPGNYFIRRHDLDTGELISLYSPEEQDTTFATNFGDIFFKKDRFDRYLSSGDSTTFTRYILRTSIDTTGNIIKESDTVYYSKFNEYVPQSNVYQSGIYDMEIDQEGNYYFVDVFIPNDTSQLSRMGYITKYDSQFNEIKTIYFDSLGIYDFSEIRIDQISEDRLMMTFCRNLNPFRTCLRSFVIFDKELNEIDRIQLTTDEGEDILYTFPHFNADEDEFLFTDTEYDRANHIDFYKPNGNGFLSLDFQLEFDTTDYTGFINALFFLDNGDILAKINYSCVIGGDKRSWHPEWFRFKAEDLDISSLTDESYSQKELIHLYPNPVHDILTLQLETGIQGKLIISNMEGKQFYEKELNTYSSEHLIDCTNFQKGMYILNVFDNNERKVYYRKFVKM